MPLWTITPSVNFKFEDEKLISEIVLYNNTENVKNALIVLNVYKDNKIVDSKVKSVPSKEAAFRLRPSRKWTERRVGRPCTQSVCVPSWVISGDAEEGQGACRTMS